MVAPLLQQKHLVWLHLSKKKIPIFNWEQELEKGARPDVNYDRSFSVWLLQIFNALKINSVFNLLRGYFKAFWNTVNRAIWNLRWDTDCQNNEMANKSNSSQGKIKCWIHNKMWVTNAGSFCNFLQDQNAVFHREWECQKYAYNFWPNKPSYSCGSWPKKGLAIYI